MSALRALRSLAVFSAVFAFTALVFTSFHVVPTLEGDWRGLLDPPRAGRLALAAAAGLLGAVLERRRPSLFGPLLALGLAAAPLVPVSTGAALPLLALQGPTLVLVVATAAAVALASLAPRPSGRWNARLAFLAALTLSAALSTRLPGPAGAQGDEPHYLAMAESLRSDFDLDLRDEFRQRAYRSFYSGELHAHTSPASPRGQLYTIHAPGLPALLLLPYAIGGSLGARAFMLVVTALTASLVFALVRDVLRDDVAAWAACAAFACLAPVAFHANLIYPEVPAMLSTAAFLLTSRRDASPATLLVAGSLAGALIWIHPKFLPLALVGLGLTLLRRGCGVAWRGVAALLFASGLLSLLAWMNAVYGQASLTAAYGPAARDDLRLANLIHGLPGLFFDREFGLLLHAPLWLLVCVGLPLLWSERASDAMRALLLAAAVIVVGAAYSMWWGGASPPARFLVPAMPALALLVAPAFARLPRLSAGLFGLGIGVVLVAAGSPRALHNRADGHSALLRVLAPALRLDQALPSFVGSEAAWEPLAAGSLDARGAAMAALLEWDGANVSSAAGRLSPNTLVIPVADDLPWRLAADETRNSPRLALPAGTYELRLQGQVDSGVVGRVARVVATLDDRDAARAFLGAGEPSTLTLEVPPGGSRLTVWAIGLREGGTLEAIELWPQRVVPRSQR